MTHCVSAGDTHAAGAWRRCVRRACGAHAPSSASAAAMTAAQGAPKPQPSAACSAAGGANTAGNRPSRWMSATACTGAGPACRVWGFWALSCSFLGFELQVNCKHGREQAQPLYVRHRAHGRQPCREVTWIDFGNTYMHSPHAPDTGGSLCVSEVQRRALRLPRSTLQHACPVTTADTSSLSAQSLACMAKGVHHSVCKAGRVAGLAAPLPQPNARQGSGAMRTVEHALQLGADALAADLLAQRIPHLHADQSSVAGKLSAIQACRPGSILPAFCQHFARTKFGFWEGITFCFVPFYPICPFCLPFCPTPNLSAGNTGLPVWTSPFMPTEDAGFW